jgi:predicted nucleotidyltransferase component of viral defense system
MIALTLQDVLNHQAEVQWPELFQVEQDLLLSLAMTAIFNDKFLATQVAMRGGTVLHKVHLAPPARYSEDIDLVAVGDRSEAHIKKALMRVLREILGKEKSSAWTWLKLAVRNAAKPSRILRCIFKMQSVAEPARELTIEVEVNVSERNPKFELQKLPFALSFRGESQATTIISYNINEMLGTKLRAMFQRKKGRDLFDLYWALTAQAAVPVDASAVLVAFTHYMRDESTTVPRGEFLAHLTNCLADKKGFCLDMAALLKRRQAYDPATAGEVVIQRLLNQLPD